MTQFDLDTSDLRQTVLQQLLQFEPMGADKRSMVAAPHDADPDLAVPPEQGISSFRDNLGDESLAVDHAGRLMEPFGTAGRDLSFSSSSEGWMGDISHPGLSYPQQTAFQQLHQLPLTHLPNGWLEASLTKHQELSFSDVAIDGSPPHQTSGGRRQEQALLHDETAFASWPDDIADPAGFIYPSPPPDPARTAMNVHSDNGPIVLRLDGTMTADHHHRQLYGMAPAHSVHTAMFSQHIWTSSSRGGGAALPISPTTLPPFGYIERGMLPPLCYVHQAQQLLVDPMQLMLRPVEQDVEPNDLPPRRDSMKISDLLNSGEYADQSLMPIESQGKKRKRLPRNQRAAPPRYQPILPAPSSMAPPPEKGEDDEDEPPISEEDTDVSWGEPTIKSPHHYKKAKAKTKYDSNKKRKLQEPTPAPSFSAPDNSPLLLPKPEPTPGKNPTPKQILPSPVLSRRRPTPHLPHRSPPIAYRPPHLDAKDPIERKELENAFLLECRDRGMRYEEIRTLGQFDVCAGSLRTRYRFLTKAPSERPREPPWADEDIELLKIAVSRFTVKGKVVWKQVAEYVSHHSESHKFVSQTCSTKWRSLQWDKNGPSGQGSSRQSKRRSATATTPMDDKEETKRKDKVEGE